MPKFDWKLNPPWKLTPSFSFLFPLFFSFELCNKLSWQADSFWVCVEHFDWLIDQLSTDLALSLSQTGPLKFCLWIHEFVSNYRQQNNVKFYIVRKPSLDRTMFCGMTNYLSPVSTTRVHGPSWRVSKNAPEFTCHQLGPWTRVVETGLK